MNSGSKHTQKPVIRLAGRDTGLFDRLLVQNQSHCFIGMRSLLTRAIEIHLPAF